MEDIYIELAIDRYRKKGVELLRQCGTSARQLPSWTPDWSTKLHCTPLPTLGGKLYDDVPWWSEPDDTVLQLMESDTQLAPQVERRTWNKIPGYSYLRYEFHGYNMDREAASAESISRRMRGWERERARTTEAGAKSGFVLFNDKFEIISTHLTTGTAQPSQPSSSKLGPATPAFPLLSNKVKVSPSTNRDPICKATYYTVVCHTVREVTPTEISWLMMQGGPSKSRAWCGIPSMSLTNSVSQMTLTQRGRMRRC